VRSSLVLGAGGLLGRSICRQLAIADPNSLIHQPPICWSDENQAKLNLSDAVSKWFDATGCDTWELFWCAGKATPNSSDALASLEQHYFMQALEILGAQIQTKETRSITIFLASSAGGVYGDTSSSIATELSTPAPLGRYGNVKISMETALRGFAEQSGCRAVIGRLSSLFGSEQNLTKRQGLLSYLAYSLALNQTINIFTSLTTTRNYLDVDTASRIILRHMRDKELASVVTRNICSPHNTSVAELITLSRQLSAKRLLIRLTNADQINNSRVATEFPDEVSSLTRSTLAESFAKLLQSTRLNLANSAVRHSQIA